MYQGNINLDEYILEYLLTHLSRWTFNIGRIDGKVRKKLSLFENKKNVKLRCYGHTTNIVERSRKQKPLYGKTIIYV